MSTKDYINKAKGRKNKLEDIKILEDMEKLIIQN